MIWASLRFSTNTWQECEQYLEVEERLNKIKCYVCDHQYLILYGKPHRKHHWQENIDMYSLKTSNSQLTLLIIWKLDIIEILFHKRDNKFTFYEINWCLVLDWYIEQQQQKPDKIRKRRQKKSLKLCPDWFRLLPFSMGVYFFTVTVRKQA